VRAVNVSQGTVFPSVRRAQLADAAALAELVNRAYEVEGFFVDGLRTSAEEIARMIRAGTFLVLERAGDRPALAAAVYVETSPEGGYFGMLSVSPEMQGMGLGTRLVRIAEAMCEAMGAPTVRLRIVNLREELGRWYRSLGYEEIGTTPYDHRPVKQPCHFVEMQRSIIAQAGTGVRAPIARQLLAV
jgi:N-acetylglutamate synthase-like GNAT family acetyltransferase